MVFFAKTNETLEAITSALSITPNDQIISICGSGAVPFALLEYLSGSAELLAVDKNAAQITFARKIAEFIKTGANKELAKLTPNEENYFCKKSRQIKIVQNLSKLSFKLMDVSKCPEIAQKFSKGYFSNATLNFKYFHQFFCDNALVYVTFGANNDIPNNVDKFLEQRSKMYGYRIQDFYDVDKARTEYACQIEAPNLFRWTPVVFRKKC